MLAFRGEERTEGLNLVGMQVVFRKTTVAVKVGGKAISSMLVVPVVHYRPCHEKSVVRTNPTRNPA